MAGIVGTPDGLDVTVVDGQLQVAAAATATPTSATVTTEGEGCTQGGCGRRFEVHVPITIAPLGAPGGTLTEFTHPSPDRVAAATPLAGSGARLRDEALVTVGTDDRPGTRTQADSAAADVGAVVSGGIASLGVYEVRWQQPQDIDARVAQLRSRPGVDHASDSSISDVSDTEVLGDLAGRSADMTWPYRQVMAPEAWVRTTGSPAWPVGIVETDFADGTHSELNVTTYVGLGRSFLTNPGDHATRVAALACGRQDGSYINGLAWGCPIITGAVTRADTSVMTWKSILTIADGVARAGASIVNMSIGMNPDPGDYVSASVCGTSTWADGALKASRAMSGGYRRLFMLHSGVIWTLSAGNSCRRHVLSPPGQGGYDLPNVITVAASNSGSSGSLASFSNFGPEVEVAAPGGVSVPPDGTGVNGVWSASLRRDPLAPDINFAGTDDFSPSVGTSFAAPIVAGIANLVRTAHPTYTAAEAARCITATAGTGGVGSSGTRSTDPHVAPGGEPFAPSDAVPIVNADAAVDCAADGARGVPATGISAGGSHTCALLRDGGAKCWGANSSGQLGTGDTIDRKAPPATAIDLGGTATQISAGVSYTCALLSDGAVKCWGDNYYGALGNGENENDDDVHQPGSPISLGGDATQITAGGHACALLSGGDVKCWGNGTGGQLGTGDNTNLNAPPASPIDLGGSASQISAGGGHTCALLTDSTVKCWGSNYHGELGLGDNTDRDSPPASPIDLGAPAIQIRAGGASTCALLANGDTKCWGFNGNGGLGLGDTTDRNAPPTTPIEVGASAIQIENFAASCAVLSGGSIKCWGSNIYGQLGTEDTADRSTPPASPVDLGGRATGITSGGGQTCALLSDGGVKCWGDNRWGQLGTGDKTNRTAPPANPIDLDGATR